jgi:ABC-2 type transport system ATP-binding protein
MDAIEIKNFSKQYGDLTAVNNISLNVNKGELFGLIGPDGAGKTTLMRSLCTLLDPNSGTITIDGMDVTKEVRKVRSILGYMPQQFSLYQDLTVKQNLQFFADIFQVPVKERERRLKQLFQFSKLEPFKNRAAGALSGGMKQKLALSCALIHTPDVLVLDEPTFGVDPVSRQEFWAILHDIKAEGKTIFVSTAYMEEADQCDKVALFHHGAVVALGEPESLKKKYRFPLYRVESNNLRELQNYFQNNAQIHSTQLFGDSLHVSFINKPTERIWTDWQNETNLLTRWESIPPSIEDVFLELVELN